MGPVTAMGPATVTRLPGDTPITPLSAAMSMPPFMAFGVIRTKETTKESSLS
jgi:hypothetical protein